MLKAGFAEGYITPPVGVDLCGFVARKGPSVGVGDALHAKWVNITDGKNQALLGSADLVGLSRNFYASLATHLQRTTRVPKGAICLATTHTHSGPATVPLHHCGRINRAYMQRLAIKLTSPAVKATHGRRPVHIGVAKGSAQLSFNRRNAQRGYVNHDVTTVMLQDERADSPLLAIGHYACHPVVLGSDNLLISADYPNYFRHYLRVALKAPVMFLNGACGDIDPKDRNKAGLHRAEKMGAALAKSAVTSLERIDWLEDTRLDVSRTHVELPVHVPRSGRELENRFEEMTTRFGLPEFMFRDELQKRKQALKEGRFPRAIRIQLQLISFGSGLALIMVPGEVFSELGKVMTANSPFRHTLICGFSNGTVGYLPTRKAYSEGGYEPHFAHFFYGYPELSPAIEDVLVAGAERLYTLAAR